MLNSVVAAIGIDSASVGLPLEGQGRGAAIVPRRTPCVGHRPCTLGGRTVQAERMLKANLLELAKKLDPVIQLSRPARWK